MKKIIIVLVVVYIVSAIAVWSFVVNGSGTKTNEVASLKTSLDTEKAARESAEKKITDTRTNVAFLSLALCPTLEATDKEALCIKNSTEWLSQTILAGTELTDPTAKAKMDTLLLALSAKTKPTAKQLYEMLKPVEVAALQSLSSSTK